ncbi:hypothetical protein [Methylobacterium sp. Leaf108]|uniref:hypothetical protein n=1 Tax=Methylobacterium sp. Leaf108 TaxID=1736256 RepID=UPI0012E89968|nr:hypothetical protein [Methylobacterium sp. Leaf108]
MSDFTAAQLSAKLRLVPLKPEALNTSNSDDRINKMASDREYVDLKLEAAEARGEARFVEINAKLDRLLESSEHSRVEIATARSEVRQDYRSTRNTVVVTTIATGLAISALILAIMTYGDAIFSRGMSVRDVVAAAAKEQAEKSQPPVSLPPGVKPAQPLAR